MHGHIVPISSGQGASIADLAAHIRDAHASVISAFNSAIDNAITAGKLLIEAKADKKLIPHGQWGKFLKRCDVGERQSQRYMKLAELVEANPTSKSDLADLTIEQVIKRLSPPKAAPASKQIAEPEPPISNSRKLVVHNIIEAWLAASPADRTKAVDSIGLEALLAAVPAAWLPLLADRLADRLTIVAPEVAVDPTRMIPEDLDIPGTFLDRRRLAATPVVVEEPPCTAEDEGPGDLEAEEDDDPIEALLERKRERERKIKYVEYTKEIAGAIDYVFGDLEELASECREVVETAPENLQQSERIQTFEISADELENLRAPEMQVGLGKNSVTYSLPKRRYLSRDARASDAATILEACMHTLEEMIPDGDDCRADAQALIGEFQSAIDTIETCEFPGMYG